MGAACSCADSPQGHQPTRVSSHTEKKSLLQAQKEQENKRINQNNNNNGGNKIQENKKVTISDVLPKEQINFKEIQPEEVIDQITEENRLAEGRFGEVFKVIWEGKEVAIKKMRYSDKRELESFISEVKLLSSLSHPNILSFYAACIEPPHVYLLSQLAEKGSLFDVIHSGKYSPLDWSTRLSVAAQLAAGMLYLHLQNPPIVHRDLKSPNILLGKDNTVVVADFGLCKVKEHTFVSTKTTAGSPAWMAPEILRGEHFSHKSDVYGFAIVLWEILSYEIPWSEDDYNFGQIVGMVGFNDLRPPMPEIPDGCPSFFPSLINECWNSDPTKRPDFEHIYKALRNFAPPATRKSTDCLLEVYNPFKGKTMRSLPQMETKTLELGIIGFDD